MIQFRWSELVIEILEYLAPDQIGKISQQKLLSYRRGSEQEWSWGGLPLYNMKLKEKWKIHLNEETLQAIYKWTNAAPLDM